LGHHLVPSRVVVGTTRDMVLGRVESGRSSGEVFEDESVSILSTHRSDREKGALSTFGHRARPNSALHSDNGGAIEGVSMMSRLAGSDVACSFSRGGQPTTTRSPKAAFRHHMKYRPTTRTGRLLRARKHASGGCVNSTRGVTTRGIRPRDRLRHAGNERHFGRAEKILAREERRTQRRADAGPNDGVGDVAAWKEPKASLSTPAVHRPVSASAHENPRRQLSFASHRNTGDRCQAPAAVARHHVSHPGSWAAGQADQFRQ